MMLGILGHIGDDDEARAIVKRLVEGLPSGSYLTLCDGTNILSEAGVEAQRLYNQSGAVPYRLRSPTRSPSSSRGWSWWNRAWCRAPGGGPTPPSWPAAPPPRWTSSPAWPASPEPVRAWMAASRCSASPGRAP
jgi:S-adenosyl methyltransferase